VLRQIERKTGLRRFKNSTIGAWLNITSDENAALIEAGLGDYLNARERRVSARATKAALRMAAVEKNWEPTLTVAALKAKILASDGITAGIATIWRDLRRLNLACVPAGIGRPDLRGGSGAHLFTHAS